LKVTYCSPCGACICSSSYFVYAGFAMLFIDSSISAYVPPFRFVSRLQQHYMETYPAFTLRFFVALPLIILQHVVVSSWSIHAVRYPSTPLASLSLAVPPYSHPGARSRLSTARQSESLVARDSDFLSKRSCKSLVERDCISLSVR